MNILDILAVAILALSAAAGYYQGLLATTANVAGVFVSLFSANWLSVAAAQSVKQADKVIPALLYYSESADMLGSVDNYRASVTAMTQPALESILRTVQLPYPVDRWLSENVLNLHYASLGLTNLGDYLSRTIAETAVNIGCFLMLFFGIYLAVTLIVNLVHYVVKLPTLKILDGFTGAVLGLGRGVLLVLVVFMVLPVVLSMLPVAQVSEIVEGSQVAGLFYHQNFVLDMVRSYIP